MTDTKRAVAPLRTWLLGALAAAHVTIIAGFFVVLAIGRVRFVGTYLYLIPAVLFLDVYVALRGWELKQFQWSLPGWFKSVDGPPWNPRMFAIVFFGVTTLLLVAGRGVAYYAGLSALFVMLLLAIRDVGKDERGGWILPATMATAGLFIAGQVFVGGYYVRDYDTAAHIARILALIETHHLTALEELRYAEFPLFHIMSSIVVQQTGLPARTAAALIIMTGFTIAVPSMFVLIRGWYASTEVARYSAVLVAILPPFLDFGSKAHAQSYAFLLFVLVAHLLLFGDRSHRKFLVFVLLAVGWNVSHHFSVFMGLVLLAPAVAIWAARVIHPEGTTAVHRTRLRMYSVLSTITVVQWAVISTFVGTTISWIFVVSPQAQGRTSYQYAVKTYGSDLELLAASTQYFIDNLYYAPLMALGLAGLWWVLLSEDLSRDAKLVVVGLFGASVAVFFPSPVWIVLEGIANINRWHVVAIPFLVLVFAPGLKFILEADRRHLAIVFLTLLVFTNVAIGYSNPTLSTIAGEETDYDRYISGAELRTMTFVDRYEAGSQAVRLPYPHLIYLEWYDAASQMSINDDITALRVSRDRSGIVYGSGLNVVPVESFREDRLRVKFLTPSGAIVTNIGSETTRLCGDTMQKVYNSGNTIIVSQPEVGGELPENEGSDTTQTSCLSTTER